MLLGLVFTLGSDLNSRILDSLPDSFLPLLATFTFCNKTGCISQLFSTLNSPRAIPVQYQSCGFEISLLGGKLVNRDSQSPGTPSRALEPRRLMDLPCGTVNGGGQTVIFRIVAGQTLNLLFDFACAGVAYELITIMEVNPHDPDFNAGYAFAFTRMLE